DTSAGEQNLDHLPEIRRIEQGDEMRYLVEAVGVVQRAQALERRRLAPVPLAFPLTRAPLHLLTEPPVQLGRAAAASLLRRQRGIEQRQQQRTAEPACALVHRRFITLQKQVGRADLARTRRHYRRAKREIPAPLTVG